MGIFSRISTLFKAEANAAIDKMEDPEKVLNQTIRDMQEQLNSAKTQVAESIAYEKRLKIQYDKAVERAKEWEGKAMQAVNAGRDDLAVEALSRKEEAEKEAAQFRVQWEAQKKGCDQIKEKLKAMNKRNAKNRFSWPRPNVLKRARRFTKRSQAWTKAPHSRRSIAWQKKSKRSKPRRKRAKIWRWISRRATRSTSKSASSNLQSTAMPSPL